MTTFFIDLWQDLREKRLWPVAVGLLAAMAAVPVVLFKPAGETPLPPTTAANSTIPELLPVVSVDSGPSRGSKLESFDQKNPFSPLKDLQQDATATASAATAAESGASSGSSEGSPLGSAAGGSHGSGPGGPGGSGGTTTEYFRYTVDVSLGESGEKAAKIEGVKQTQLLPDGEAPLLAYMGLADDARTAVFFIIDPAYSAQGEGKCRPKGDDCRFIYLGVNDDGDEESIFTADGESEYTLKLLKINREGISPTQAKGDSSDSRPAAKRASKRAAKALESKDVPSLLDLPALLAERR